MAAAAWCSSHILMLLLSCTCCGAASTAANEKLTHLQFYFHEVIVGTPNATVVSVVSLDKYVPSSYIYIVDTHDHITVYTNLKLIARVWLQERRSGVRGREGLGQRAA